MVENVCAQIGKVRRLKFYKDDRGGLKGDALVTFASPAMMHRCIERVIYHYSYLLYKNL